MGLKKIINHYLSISNKVLIKNKIIHKFFYLIEISTLFLQIIEIFYYKFNVINRNIIVYFSPFAYLCFQLNKISEPIKSLLYLIIIIIIINSFLLNTFKPKINTYNKFF